MKKLLGLVLSITYSFTVSGSCDKPVIILEKGQTSPCTGYLFSPEAEKQARKTVLELELERQVTEAQNRQIGLYQEETVILEEQRNLWKTQAEASTKALIEAEDNKSWEMILWFGLGVAATTAITYGVNQK